MDVQEMVDRFRDALSVSRVYGEPIERGGTTVIPAARIRGGGGGGDSQSKGTGGGFGVNAAPAGVWVLSDGRAVWRPAIDVNRIILGAQLVAIFALLTVRTLLRRRS
jgi:uncharacterized spore protein YtfJ